MKKILFSFLLLYLCISISNAKNNQSSVNHIPAHRTCSTVMPPIEWENNFQQQIQQFLANQQSNSANRVLANYTIPVVVHVVYWNTTQNISQAQVNSQIDILNADFAGTGLNVGNLPSAFASKKANTNISFCLAQKTPTGATMAEPGIDRVNAQTKGYSNPSTSGYTTSYIDNSIKPNTIWNPTKYMNIWVLYIENGLLGYATFPAGTGLSGLSGLGTATSDGVVIGHLYFGNTGTASSSAPYNKGRTATHEVGHWLGLRHISGDSECGTDYCADTPPQKGNAGDGQGLNYGCPTYPHLANSCTGTGANGELFMDFMDYSDDLCMYIFTNDQRTRMQTAMLNGTYRAPLATSDVCSSTPQAPVADFTATPTSICPGSTVQFTDLSTNTPTSWSWSFTGGTPATVAGTNAAAQNPLITYNTGGTYAVTLTATNAQGSNSITKTNYIVVATQTGSALPLVEGFEATTFPPTGWSLVSNSGFNWERHTGNGGFGTSNACMKFNNTDNDGNYLKDDMLSPTLSISNVTSPRVKFDVAYAPYNDGITWDTLEVLIRDVCTGASTSIYKKGGNQLATAPAQGAEFYPTSTQWRIDSVNIPTTFLNKNVKVIFRNYGLYGHTIYVDNINIYGATTTSGTPTASFTSSNTTVCAGQSLTFTSTSTSSSGSLDSIRWTIPTGTPSTGTTSPITSTFNTVGNYTITLKAYKSGNVSTATQAITVNAVPTVAALTGTTSICVGTTTTLSSTTGGGVWSTSASNIATVNNGIVTGVAVGNATISYTVTSNGCSKTVTASVTVNAIPTVAALTGTTSVCVGATTTLSSTTAGGVWSTSASNIATVNNGIVTGVAVGNATISYTVTSNGCSKTVTASVTVNAIPTVAAITGTTSVCVGATTTLSSTTAGGVWSTSTSNIASVNNGVVTGVASGVATISYTVTSNGCSKTVTASVTVNAVPTVAAITGTTNVCVGATTTLSSTTAGGVWSTSASNIATVNNGIVTGVAAGNATISYTVTSNGCSKTVTASVTVNAIPTVAVLTGTTSVCVGATTTLSSTTSGGVWSTSASNIATVNNGIVTGVAAGNATISYTVTSNGCSKTVTTSVSVNAAPTVAAITGTTSVCVGATTILSSTTGGGVWSTSASNIATVNNGIVTGVAAGTANIYYTVTANGCTKSVYTIVTVNAIPTVAAITGTTSVCVGATTTLSSTTGGGVWTTSASNIATVNPNGVVTGVAAGTANIYYTVTANGCSKSVAATVTVNAIPTVAALTGTTSVCVGGTTTLSSTTSGGVWSTSASNIATVNNGVVAGVAVGNATISYTVTSNGCSKTVTASVTVNAIPTVAAITGITSVCVGATTTLSSTTGGGVWSTSASNIATVNNGVVTGVAAGNATISYTVTSNGCSKTVTATVTVNAIPTVAALTGTTSVCVGGTTTLSSSTAGGVWSTSASNIATVNNGVVTGVAVGTANIYYTVTANGCSKSVAATVTVNAVPNVTATSTSICAGGTATLTASGANTYLWSTGSPNVSITVSPTITTSYTVTGTSNGCSKIATATVTVNTSAPTVTITPNTSSVCNGDAITLTANGAGNYNWSQTGTVLNNTLTFIPTVNPTTVTVTGSVTGCTTTGSATSTITIKQKPTVAVNSPSICNGQTAQLQAGGATTYTWTGGLPSIENPTTPALFANQSYTVTGTTDGCTGTAIANVTVKPAPATPTITQRNDTLTCTTITGISYKWYLNGNLLTTTIVNYLKITQNGVYTVEAIGTNQCTSVRSANFNASLTGIKNNRLDIQYSIVPNPNNGSFEIKISSISNKIYQLKLFNVSGQTILSEELNIRVGQNSKQFNLNGIEKGVYFLTLFGDDGIDTQNIIIQ